MASGRYWRRQNTSVNIIVTGGFEPNFAVGFIKGLAANGVKVCVVSCDETAPRLEEAGIVHLNLRGSQAGERPFWVKLGNLVCYYERLLLLLFRHRGATVHFTGTFRNKFILWDGLLMNLCFRALAGRYLYTVHNVLPHSREHSRFFRWVYQRVYRIPHILLVHTGRARRQLIEEFDVPESKIRLTSIGLNEEMPVTALTPAEARSRLGLGAQERVILFFGKIDEYKGLDLLLDAFERLDVYEARLVIAGGFRSQPYRDRIHSQLRRMERKSRVSLYERFIPNEEAEVFFKAGDVLCLPYRHIYQSGLVFLGPRFGIPMVTTDVGSLREFVGGEFGIVTASNDAAGVASALELFFRNPSRFSREEILAQAQNYRWEVVCRELVPLYASRSSGTVSFAVSQTSSESGCRSDNLYIAAREKPCSKLEGQRL